MALTFKERMSIAKYQGELVKKAEKLVKDNEIWKKLKENQLRNVADVAMGTECVPVVTNFIRYQRGRHNEWKGIAEQVITIFEQQLSQKPEGITPDNKDEAWIKLCRDFWGYVIRYDKFVRKLEEENKKKGREESTNV